MTDPTDSSSRGTGSWARGFSAALGSVDLVILILLGALLLPLVIGPFLLVYEFFNAGALPQALLIGGVFAACTGLAIRAVRRAEFGPGLLAAALALLGFMFFMATRLPR